MRHHHQRRSKGHSREGGDDRSGDCWVASVINQVIRGSKAATGLGKGPVITLFVLGFIFMPLLTGLVFFAMLFWTANPAKARESVDRFTDHVKRAGKHFTDATRGQPRPSRGATQPDVDLADDEEDGSGEEDAEAPSSATYSDVDEEPSQDQRTPGRYTDPTVLDSEPFSLFAGPDVEDLRRG